MKKKLRKKLAKVLVSAYLVYSVLTDTLIWGGAFYYFLIH